jgi:hypothetical protein
MERVMTTYIVHETYEYYIDASSKDEAIELFENYRNGDNENDTEEVSFTQNYLHFYNTDMEEQ